MVFVRTRDKSILELAGRLEHKHISEKHQQFKMIQSKIREIKQKIVNQGHVDDIRDALSSIERALGYEVTLLRTLDSASRNPGQVDKENLLSQLNEEENTESNAIGYLRKAFSGFLGIKVDKEAKQLKSEIKDLLDTYHRLTTKSFEQTRTLLEKLNQS